MATPRGALLGLVGCVLLASSRANHFRYGDISWATCRNSEAPHAVFYDPLFPDVCKECDSGLCIGATVQVAFQVSSKSESHQRRLASPHPAAHARPPPRRARATDQRARFPRRSLVQLEGDLVSPFMTYLAADVAAYQDSGHTQRTLRLKRNQPGACAPDDAHTRPACCLSHSVCHETISAFASVSSRRCPHTSELVCVGAALCVRAVGLEKDSRELRIGYRQGFGDASLVPDVADDTSGLASCLRNTHTRTHARTHTHAHIHTHTHTHTTCRH